MTLGDPVRLNLTCPPAAPMTSATVNGAAGSKIYTLGSITPKIQTEPAA